MEWVEGFGFRRWSSGFGVKLRVKGLCMQLCSDQPRNSKSAFRLVWMGIMMILGNGMRLDDYFCSFSAVLFVPNLTGVLCAS